jgi:hypothetical protein
VPQRGFGDEEDPSVVLTWRLRTRLPDATEAQRDNRRRSLAALTLAQLHTLTKLAAAHRAAAREALRPPTPRSPRVQSRLDEMHRRTTAERAALLPPTSPLRQPPPDTNAPGHRLPTR